MLSLYREIASTVAGEIEIAVTPAERRRLGDAPPVDEEVYNNYLLGLHEARFGTEARVVLGLEYLHRAVTLDPTYAAAWAGLAQTYVRMVLFHIRSVGEVLPLAVAAADSAVKLGDDLADAHLAQGMLWLVNWDYQQAEGAFERALDIRPNDAQAHSEFGHLLAVLDRREDSFRHATRATEIDPANVSLKGVQTWGLHIMGESDAAVRQARELIAANPGHSFALWVLAVLHMERGEYEKAIETLDLQMPLMQGYITDEVAVQGMAYGLLGQEVEAQQALSRLDSLETEGKLVLAIHRAWIWSSLGERDRAFGFLTQAVEDREALPSFSRFMFFDALRSDPRFRALIDGAGLAPYFE